MAKSNTVTFFDTKKYPTFFINKCIQGVFKLFFYYISYVSFSRISFVFYTLFF